MGCLSSKRLESSQQPQHETALHLHPKNKKHKNQCLDYDYRLIWLNCLFPNQNQLDIQSKNHIKIFQFLSGEHIANEQRKDRKNQEYQKRQQKEETKFQFYHPSFIQISKDLDRTFPNIPHFNTPHSQNILEQVLQKFTLFFPKVGYTQGLNYIAGTLLLNNLSQRQTLKVMVQLCTKEDLMLLGLYQDNFPLCRLYCQIFWVAISKLSQERFQLIRGLGLPDQLWIFQWFLTLFVYSLPFGYLSQIFNFVIVKRSFAVVRLALAIFKLIQEYFLSYQSSHTDLTQQKLIEFFYNMKSQSFSSKHLKLQKIIEKAEKIKHSFIIQCLSETKISNFYKHYFLGKDNSQFNIKHARFMEDLQKQRQIFFTLHEKDKNTLLNNMNSSNNFNLKNGNEMQSSRNQSSLIENSFKEISKRYLRQSSSIMIIYNIETTYRRRLSRILSNKEEYQGARMCSQISLRKCNSMGNFKVLKMQEINDKKNKSDKINKKS